MLKIKKIIIIGGGAAGLELATRLGNSLGRKSLAEIMLIDKNLSYIWKPLWHEVAAGRIIVSKDETEYLAQSDQHDFKFKLGTWIGLDQKQKLIRLKLLDYDNADIAEEQTLTYDILIIAIGSVHNSFNTSGADEFCLSFDNINECNVFHKTLIINLFRLVQANQKELHISIIGGGSTGIELAFEVKNTILGLLKYKSIFNKNIKVNLNIIESSSTILGGLSTELVKEIVDLLNVENIRVYTGERVVKIDKNMIYTNSGMEIRSDIKLWAAGIKAPNILTTINLEINNKNQLLLQDTLQVTKDEHIFAIGDCANFANNYLPPSAQLAHQQAKFLAKSITENIKSAIELKKFVFVRQGTIISASKIGAIGEIETGIAGKITLNRKVAYFSYRFLYRRYQIALYGWSKVLILIIIDFLLRRIKPSVKLH